MHSFQTTSFVLILSFLAVPVLSAPTAPLSPYAPVQAACPVEPLVRPGNALGALEKSYRTQRKSIADVALRSWLEKTNPAFTAKNGRVPTVALTTSGGGYRSLLLGAGVIQGLDALDSDVSTSGLLQAITYQAGLSGGGWLLSSLAGNNYPTVSSLRDNLWGPAFMDGLQLPGGPIAPASLAFITQDLAAKEAAGFPPTLTDPWARLLSYQLLYGYDGGVSTTMSSITGFSKFTSHAIPYPIITALGVKTFNGECVPGPDATQYEFGPYEFGSWNKDISAFASTKYLGSSLVNGKPANAASCINNYDNLGYILGTSSSLFNVPACQKNPAPPSPLTNQLNGLLATAGHTANPRDVYAAYPNPFYQYTSPSSQPNAANNIAAQPELDLVDGGEALQNNPIWPMLQPARAIDVLIVNDNSADSNNFPNGSEILTTYIQSLNEGLTRMPFIPSVETFVAQGLNKRATFFGCNDPNKLTIVYLPNVNYTYPSNVPTAKLQYTIPETNAMIANGVQMAIQGGESGWATCLGCAIEMKAGGNLPAECTACFAKHCYYGN
ncbi:Lysophospholipase 1 [Elasticomyces elasticus]|nr:hypothetical protein LTR28_001782 [Elasticomyces elasticus]KAK4996132.1 Lysophospholipase 1 [Elasticomyces elasticus]